MSGQGRGGPCAKNGGNGSILAIGLPAIALLGQIFDDPRLQHDPVLGHLRYVGDAERIVQRQILTWGDAIEHMDGGIGQFGDFLLLVAVADMKIQLAGLTGFGHAPGDHLPARQHRFLNRQRLDKRWHLGQLPHGGDIEISFQQLTLNFPHPLKTGDRRIEQLANGVGLVLFPDFIFQRCGHDFGLHSRRKDYGEGSARFP